MLAYRLRRRQFVRLIRETHVIMGLGMCLLIWSAVLYKHVDQHAAAIQDEAKNGYNLALLFEETTLRSIGEADKALLYLRRQIENRFGRVNLQDLISTTDIISEIIVQAAVIDHQGIMRASNANKKPDPIDLSDREHFKYHLTAQGDTLFISKPVLGRASGKWSIQLTRRFLDQDGNFAGVVVASLDPEHLTGLFQSIDIGPTSSASLIGIDGIVRASGGVTGAGRFKLGQNLSTSLLFRRIEAAESGNYFDMHNDGGDDRFVTYRKVRGQPLVVSISVSNTHIFMSVYRELQRNILIGAILSALALNFSLKGARQQFELRKNATVLRRSEKHAALKSEQLRLTLDNISQGIILVTKDLRIPVINRQALQLLGLPESYQSNPPTFTELIQYQEQSGEFANCNLPEGMTPLSYFLRRNSEGENVNYERTRPNGTVLEIRSKALAGGGFVRTYGDITQRRIAQSTATRLAMEDALTGLPNRRVLNTAVEEAIANRQAQSDEVSTAPSVALLLLDLDRFKAVNDTLGHPVGDLLLQAVSKRLMINVRSTDVVARLGGDEFAVLLPQLPSEEAVVEIANRLIERLSQPYQLGEQRISIGASIGIAFNPQHGPDAESLLQAADIALYAAKTAGRATYRIFDLGMAQRVIERRAMEIDLKQAFEQGALELHYQPVVASNTGCITSFEALMRWHHPLHGMVPPAVFIPIAEETGLILPLGAWALRTACEQAKNWPETIDVAVNVSSIQFQTDDLVSLVGEILESTGLPGHRLNLEITETILMKDLAETAQILAALRDLGVKISMDDFGTGYSSLNYLQRFPLDKIKIDRSFVSVLSTSTSSEVIVRSVIDIARALDMVVTAEGVETIDQIEILKRLGAQEFQGYYFSRPVPSDKIPALLHAIPNGDAMAA